jgi:hypothetical protein
MASASIMIHGLLTLIFILHLIKRSFSAGGSFYRYQTPATNNRTAAIISGQLRSGNLTFTSGNIKYTSKLKWFGAQDGKTPIETMLQYVIEPIARYGGIDLFIFVQVRRSDENIPWNGDPYTFQPKIGDRNICNLYAASPAFRNTSNRVFCMTQYEEKLSNIFIHNNPIWKDYIYLEPHADEQLLQQLYAIYQGNLASKQYAQSAGIEYKYKIRIRPDTAVFAPIPAFDKLGLYSNPVENSSCKRNILFPNPYLYEHGVFDSFNIGLASDMDLLLDRFIDITTSSNPKEALEKYSGASPEWRWKTETNMMQVLKLRYNICVIANLDIKMLMTRKQDHKEYMTGFQLPDSPVDTWTMIG